jgi:hypothetical protein
VCVLGVALSERPNSSVSGVFRLCGTRYNNGNGGKDRPCHGIRSEGLSWLARKKFDAEHHETAANKTFLALDGHGPRCEARLRRRDPKLLNCVSTTPRRNWPALSV